MERRGFLKGLIGGITSTGLIVQATQDEIAAFADPLAKPAPVVVAPAPMADDGTVDLGTELFNKKGELVAIITGVEIETSPPIEITSFGASNRRVVQGLERNTVTITAECMRAVRIRVPPSHRLTFR
jgi:hypothetical protein